jgi:hypothetical protein
VARDLIGPSVTLGVHHNPRITNERSEDPALRLGLRHVSSRVRHDGKAAQARIDMPLNLRVEHGIEASVLLQRIYRRMHTLTLGRQRKSGLGQSSCAQPRLDSPRQRAKVAFMPTRTIAYLRVSTDKQADRGGA